MSVYARFGVEPMINAKGPGTRLSGNISRPEVRAAMAEAMGHCVDIVELHGHAAEVIARHTGAESGLVTSGAAAGLLLGAAACITGLDPGAMARLPLRGNARGETVMVRSPRTPYDHALRTTGLEIVEVGRPDRYAGAGCRDAEPWEIVQTRASGAPPKERTRSSTSGRRSSTSGRQPRCSMASTESQGAG
jgi:L-seryl-tRNA(Ser) seleniumtransferase